MQFRIISHLVTHVHNRTPHLRIHTTDIHSIHHFGWRAQIRTYDKAFGVKSAVFCMLVSGEKYFERILKGTQWYVATKERFQDPAMISSKKCGDIFLGNYKCVVWKSRKSTNKMESNVEICCRVVYYVKVALCAKGLNVAADCSGM